MNDQEQHTQAVPLMTLLIMLMYVLTIVFISLLGLKGIVVMWRWIWG